MSDFTTIVSNCSVKLEVKEAHGRYFPMAVIIGPNDFMVESCLATVGFKQKSDCAKLLMQTSEILTETVIIEEGADY